jgi:hypothetical protein
MHLLLTDRLTCPRCGPSFGLILLASRLEDRIVFEGRLGCPNCRDAFSVTSGFADLRAPPREALPAGLVGPPDDPVDADEAARMRALLGIAGGPGTVALVGEPSRYASALTASAEEIHVVGVDAGLVDWPEVPRVSRIVGEPGLPFRTSTLRAAAVDGRLGPRWIMEAVRTVAPRGRVVVTRAPDDAQRILREGGLSVLAVESETVVAARD